MNKEDGFENFANNVYAEYGDSKPAMCISGKDIDAKNIVATNSRSLGWDPIDTENIEMSVRFKTSGVVMDKDGEGVRDGADFVRSVLER